MSDEADRGLPVADSVVELISASRGDTLLSWSEGLHDGDLLVSVQLDRTQAPVSLAVGEHLELVWRDADGLRALPVELAAIDVGERSRWRLRSAGVVRRGQRRDAVRAPMTIPVRIGPEPSPVTGATLDVSEGGLRCVLDTAQQPSRIQPGGDGVAVSHPARVGDVVRVAALFPDFTVTCLAEVTATILARTHDSNCLCASWV